MTTNAQTEARATLWAPAKPDQKEIGWTYEFDQIDRITTAAEDDTGYGATMEAVQFVMAEADRRHATALAALSAELEAVKRERDKFQDDATMFRESRDFWKQAANDENRALASERAAHAETRKALEPFAEAADDLDDDHKDTSSIWECPAAVNIDAGHLRAARRAYEGGGDG